MKGTLLESAPVVSQVLIWNSSGEELNETGVTLDTAPVSRAPTRRQTDAAVLVDRRDRITGYAGAGHSVLHDGGIDAERAGAPSETAPPPVSPVPGSMVSDDLARWASVTDRAPSLVEVTAPLCSLAAVTAPFLTCLVPTLFLGRLNAA